MIFIMTINKHEKSGQWEDIKFSMYSQEPGQPDGRYISFNEFILIKAFLVIMLSLKSIITMNVPSVSPDSMLTFEPLIFQQTKLIIWRV